jgi:hypothetical protein
MGRGMRTSESVLGAWAVRVTYQRLAILVQDPQAILCSTPTYEYDKQMSMFNHEAIIQLFDYALLDRSQWPGNDAVVRQHFGAQSKRRLQVTKTGWSTTLFCGVQSDVGSRKIGDASDEGSVGSGDDMDGDHMIPLKPT